MITASEAFKITQKGIQEEIGRAEDEIRYAAQQGLAECIVRDVAPHLVQTILEKLQNAGYMAVQDYMCSGKIHISWTVV